MYARKGKRYTEEFKIEAVKQVTDRGYSVNKVAERLGITTKSLYNWRSQLSGIKAVRDTTPATNWWTRWNFSEKTNAI